MTFIKFKVNIIIIFTIIHTDCVDKYNLKMDEWNSFIWCHSNVHQYHPFIVEIHSIKKVLQKWLQKHAMYMKNKIKINPKKK